MAVEAETQYYDVFVRSWWKWSAGTRVGNSNTVINRKLVPAPGARRTYLRRHVTYEDARSTCEAYNSTHNPGKRSRKAEFISV